MHSRLTPTVRALVVAGGLLGVLGAVPLHAQDSTSPPPPPAGGRGMMRGGMRGGQRFDPYKGITLTADQKTKLDTIRAKYRQKGDSLRTANPGDMSVFRGLMESEQKEERDVLTADQQKVYDANMKEARARMEQMRQRMQQNGGQGAPPPPPPPPQQ